MAGGNQQIANYKGAFGYNDNDGTEQMRSNINLAMFRNMSTVAVPAYTAVALSSLATDGTGVVPTTVIGDRRFIGVTQEAMTSVASTAVTATSLAADGNWGRVCVEGPCWAAVTTGTAVGDVVAVGNSTAGASVGGVLSPFTTLSVGTAGSFSAIAGFALTSATTGTTGSLSTSQPRAKVFLRPSFAFTATA